MCKTSHLASAVVRAHKIPAVSVGLAGASSLRALILVPKKDQGELEGERNWFPQKIEVSD